MSYRYESTTFVVPAGYRNNLEIFVKQVSSWVSSTFPELTFDKYESSSTSYYAYFKLGDSGIKFHFGLYSSGSSFECVCHSSDVWGNSYGTKISEDSTVSLQLMVIPNLAMFCTLKSSDETYYYNSSALAVKEIVSGNSYVLSSLPGNSPDSSSAGPHLWFPSSYYYKNESNNTTQAYASTFPNNIDSLAGTISKEENGGNRVAVISPAIYMKYGPLSLLTAAEDAVKLMYANDGGMPTLTKYTPIQVGSDKYIALENPNFSSSSGGSASAKYAYLKIS